MKNVLPELSLIFCRNLSPLEMCSRLKFLTILPEIVPFPDAGAPNINDLNITLAIAKFILYIHYKLELSTVLLFCRHLSLKSENHICMCALLTDTSLGISSGT